jgi:hypothetical protein
MTTVHMKQTRFSKCIQRWMALFAIGLPIACISSAHPIIHIEVLRPYVQLEPVRVNELSNVNQQSTGSRRSSVIVVNGSLIAGGKPPPELGGELLPIRRTLKNAFRMRVDQLSQIPTLRVSLKSRGGAKNQFNALSDSAAGAHLPAVASITGLRFEERLGQRWMTGDVELLIDAAAAPRMGAFRGQLSYEIESF